MTVDRNLEEPSINSAQISNKIAELAAAKKAQNIIIIDLRGITEIFDYFVIFSGNSVRQVKVLTDFVVEELKKEKIRPLSREGAAETGWVLLDYGEVVVHIFLEETRNFYQIERLFKDAKVEEVDS